MRSVRKLSMCLLTMLLFTGLCPSADWALANRAYKEKDYPTALRESMPLAEQGNADAQLLLGRMCLMGQGVRKDPDQAIKWFKASAGQGNSDAQFMLGSMYLLPQKDVSEGVEWMRLSAEQGNKDAQYVLGKAYIKGLPGLARDSVQAEMWLWLAANENLEFYKTELNSAESQMTTDQIAKGRTLAEAWKPKPGLKREDQPPTGEKPR